MGPIDTEEDQPVIPFQSWTGMKCLLRLFMINYPIFTENEKSYLASWMPRKVNKEGKLLTVGLFAINFKKLWWQVI